MLPEQAIAYKEKLKDWSLQDARMVLLLDPNALLGWVPPRPKVVLECFSQNFQYLCASKVNSFFTYMLLLLTYLFKYVSFYQNPITT